MNRCALMGAIALRELSLRDEVEMRLAFPVSVLALTLMYACGGDTRTEAGKKVVSGEGVAEWQAETDSLRERIAWLEGELDRLTTAEALLASYGNRVADLETAVTALTADTEGMLGSLNSHAVTIATLSADAGETEVTLAALSDGQTALMGAVNELAAEAVSTSSKLDEIAQAATQVTERWLYDGNGAKKYRVLSASAGYAYVELTEFPEPMLTAYELGMSGTFAPALATYGVDSYIQLSYAESGCTSQGYVTLADNYRVGWLGFSGEEYAIWTTNGTEPASIELRSKKNGSTCNSAVLSNVQAIPVYRGPARSTFILNGPLYVGP